MEERGLKLEAVMRKKLLLVVFAPSQDMLALIETTRDL